MTGELLALYIFGSVVRHQQDGQSDLDLLAVVADGKGKVAESELVKFIPPHLRGMDISISWYGRERLTNMFKNGELFAWHLHAEHLVLFQQFPFLELFGPPAPYRGASEDIVSFSNIIASIPGQLELTPWNATYELGLIYVCLRNICMSASWVLSGRADFSRYSPFNLPVEVPTPITRAEYELAMASRLAGQRGFDPPLEVQENFVRELVARLMPWVTGLTERLERA